MKSVQSVINTEKLCVARADINGCNPTTCYIWKMLDFSIMPVINRIHVQSHKFSTGVENKATGDSKRNDSPGS